MKKKPFEIQRWMWLGGLIPLGAFLFVVAKSWVVYAEMPKRVDTIEQYVVQQRRANEINEKANQLMQQQIQQQVPQPYCELYQGATWCFDERSQTWYKPGGQ